MLALVLVYVFAVELDVLPAIGYVSISEGGLAQNLRTMILPAVSIGFPLFCFYTRLLRADIVDKMQGEDYVVTAQAKGLGPWRVLLRHALPNSLFGLLTLVALNVGTLIGATVIIESIFALPGIGQALLQSINNRDILVIEAIVLVLATIVVIWRTWSPTCSTRCWIRGSAMSAQLPDAGPSPRASRSRPPGRRRCRGGAAGRAPWGSRSPPALLGLIFFLCFVWPLFGTVPAPTGGNILDANSPRSPRATSSAPTRSATTSGRGCSTAGATRSRSRLAVQADRPRAGRRRRRDRRLPRRPVRTR